MKINTQEQQVIAQMRREGGFSTLRRLYETVDVSGWQTKTPEASIRRIVQQSSQTFKIEPGLWALEECRDSVLRQFELEPGNRQSEERFGHSYYQGLLVEIGNIRQKTTYVPAQDRNRNFIGRRLGDVCHTTVLPAFGYEKLLRRARTIDVVWLNERQMPSDFYEVEHTTDIRNSLTKFYELQDFHAGFYIVAPKSRQAEFDDKLHASMFDSIAGRVGFIDYERVVGMYESMQQFRAVKW